MSSSPPTLPASRPPSPPPRAGGSDARDSGEFRYLRSKARRDQVFACALGAVLLGVALLIQSPLTKRRATMIDEPDTSLKSLALNFPRLTLGGFRGLLATILWYQAENDKEDRKWMDLETKYDIIGAIEPYFTSIYIFHSWNQAYNLSAQWHSEDSKYKWVLDGIGYLYKGEQYNPDNPDLLLEEGNLYFLKLGGAFERIFYRAHWRDDIAGLYKLDVLKPGEKTDATEALRLVRSYVNRDEFHAMEMVDKSGVRGHGVQITDPWLFELRTDNKAAGDPVEFPYGLSPFYFGYAEYKRCLAAGSPTTIGDNIADGWPPMCLRMWCRDDLYYSANNLLQMFDPNAPQNPEQNPLDSTSRDFDAAAYSRKVLELRDCYRNVQMVAPKAVDLFNQDMGKFPMNRSVHVNHVFETQSYQAIGAAESKLLDALVNWNNEHRKLTESTRQPFRDALPAYDKAIDVTMAWVDKVSPLIKLPNNTTYVNPDRSDFERYANALKARKAGIENLLNTPPTEKPDMSFLREEVVER
jgi:hypothetical protein